MKLSLVIPCYNEAANLPLLLERCKALTARSDAEVILVDNGSTDNNPDVLAALLPSYPGCRSVRVERNQGLWLRHSSGIARRPGRNPRLDPRGHADRPP